MNSEACPGGETESGLRNRIDRQRLVDRGEQPGNTLASERRYGYHPIWRRIFPLGFGRFAKHAVREGVSVETLADGVDLVEHDQLGNGGRLDLLQHSGDVRSVFLGFG